MCIGNRALNANAKSILRCIVENSLESTKLILTRFCLDITISGEVVLLFVNRKIAYFSRAVCLHT